VAGVPEGVGEKLSARQQTLLQATDEFIKDRTITSAPGSSSKVTWIGDG